MLSRNKKKSTTSSKKQDDLPPVAPECRTLIAILDGCAPTLRKEVAALVDDWLAPLHQRLECDDVPTDPKVFNDPVWGSITLLPAEIILLDTPLLQRLRGIRQLGMAHYVYPGSGYDRLEHVRGVVEATQRIVSALDNCVDRAEISGDSVPRRKISEHEALRLAALLHDVGHAPLSHATEEVIQSHYEQELKATRKALHEAFRDVSKVATAEIISVFIILSPSFLRAVNHSMFPVSERRNLPLLMIGAILGSGKYISAPYLAGVISGPIDADKLDYMARDAHHAGLPIGLETVRLLSQLQIVKVTVNNGPSKELREKAEESTDGRYFDLGITRAGMGAYEQMIMGRAILFDRVYYHHKVRAAEAMVRRLIDLSEEDNGKPYALRNLFPSFPDETFILGFGGNPVIEGLAEPTAKTRHLSTSIFQRDLFYRAFAFAPRYIAGVEALEQQERDNTIVLLAREMLRIAAKPEIARKLEKDIASMARQIAELVGNLYEPAREIVASDIIVDMPHPDRVTAGTGQNILVGNAKGDVEFPNLYFDPEKWSQAYRSKKHCGYVYCRNELKPAVNLASKFVFAERLNVVMDEAADRLTKTKSIHRNDIIERAQEAGLISPDTAQRIIRKEARLARFRTDDIAVPSSWTAEGADVPRQLAEALNEARPRGYTASLMDTIRKLIESLAYFADISYKGGTLSEVGIGEEAKLQAALRNHIRSRQQTVDEGSEFSGGETDLIFERQIVIENKIYPTKTNNPMNVAEKYEWQARRYSIALSNDIVAIVVGYQPANESGILQSRESFLIKRLDDRKTVAIRIVLPVGLDVPSAAKAPS